MFELFVGGSSDADLSTAVATSMVRKRNIETGGRTVTRESEMDGVFLLRIKALRLPAGPNDTDRRSRQSLVRYCSNCSRYCVGVQP